MAQAPVDLRDHLRDQVVNGLVVIRRLLTTTIAAGHLLLLGLYATDRLSYTVDSRYVFLQHVAENPIWLLVHGTAAAWLLSSIVLRRHQIQACAYSAGVMGTWAMLGLVWGLTTVRPVSLIGPAMALVVTAFAYLLSQAWAIAPDPTRQA